MIPTPFAHFVLASMLVLASMRTSGGAISPADAFSMPRKADARGHRSVEPCRGRLLSGTVLAFDPLMIRSELIARIAEQNPHLYAKEVEGVVDAILDRITAALAENDRVELRDFGTFCARDREARTGRNPRTGKQVRSPARSSAR